MFVSISGAAKSISPFGFHSITLFILGLKSTLLTGLPASPFHSQKQQQKIPTPQANKKTKPETISVFLILLVLWAHFYQHLQKLPSLHLNWRNSPLFGSQIKSNCCLFHCPDKFFISCIRSLWGGEKRKREKKKAVQECRLGKVPMINGVAVTSGYLKIRQCQLPGGFCCLWQLVIIIGRLLLCTP